MKRYVVPDYKKCIVNFSSSILKQFGLSSCYSTLRKVDQAFKEEEYQNIIVLVYQGLSSNLLDQCLEESGFFRSHKELDLSSVCPSNSIVTTSSLFYGKSPYEHGDLGWNHSDITMEKDFDIIEQINQDTSYSAYGIFPFGVGAYQTRDEAYQRILNLTKHEGKKLIYSYFLEPGRILKEQGVDSALDCVSSLEQEVKKLFDQVEDSLIFVLSDHGYTSCKPLVLKSAYPLIFSFISKMKTVDGRSCSFQVKEGKQEEFRQLFLAELGEKFLLYSKEELLEQSLLGIGDEVYDFSSVIDDFFAVAIGDFAFCDDCDSFPLMAAGGLTKDEMLLPLILLKKKVPREKIRQVEKKDFAILRTLMNRYHLTNVKERSYFFRKVDALQNIEFSTLCSRSAPSRCFVYEIGDQIVAFMEVQLVITEGERLYNKVHCLRIEKVFVFPEYRRLGIATKLYQEAVQYASKVKVKRIEFVVWDFQKEAKDFIESLQSHVLHQTYEIEL